MTNELKKKMCVRDDCEICELLNELGKTVERKSELNIITRLFNH